MLAKQALAFVYLSVVILISSALASPASGKDEKQGVCLQEAGSLQTLASLIWQSDSLRAQVLGAIVGLVAAFSLVAFALGARLSSVQGPAVTNQKLEPASDSSDLSSPTGKQQSSPISSLSRRRSMVVDQEDEVRASLNDSFSMAENVVQLLTDLKDEIRSQVTERQEAVLNVAIKALEQLDPHELTVPIALVRTNMQLASSTSMPNLQVQEWLRESFTPRTGRSSHSGRSMKVVSKSIMFAVRLKRATSVSHNSTSQARDFSPFKAASEEQENRIRELLKGLDEWNFDVWGLSEATGNRELEVVGWNVMHEWGLVKKFGIETETLKNWLAHVQQSYNENDFHNATHACDVLQTVHYMLRTAKLSRYISELEFLAILISAAIHDMGHDGLNNNFHKNAVTERALSFNDQSIQEMYHVASFFKTMKENQSLDITKSLTPKQYLELRAIIIRLVLATDMSKHFQELKEFKQLVQEKGKSPEAWGEHTSTLMAMVLHACDISGQCKSEASMEKWAERCHEEFFAQGDKEAELDIPVSPLCDRSTTDIASSQVGFINFIVLPTWQAMADFFPIVAEEGLVQLKDNLATWESRLPNKPQ